MSKPGRILQALRWMGDPTSPLYLAPRFDLSLFRWLWAFRRFCTEEHVHRSMETLGPLGHESRRLFDELVAEEGLDCAFRGQGYYEAYRTEAGWAGAQKEIGLQRAHGYRTRSLSGGALREAEPALKKGTVGGVFFPEAATLDPMRFLTELADRVRRRGGEIRTGAEATGLIRSGSAVAGVKLAHGEVVEGRTVVLATGAYSPGLAEEAGLRLPIQAAKGYHRDLPSPGGSGPSMRITCMLGERFVFCTPMGDYLRLAGTLELSGTNQSILQPRLENLSRSAAEYLEGLGEGPSQDDWVGLRPCTPDGLPVIGRSPALDGLWVATGHAMLGLTLGPVTGRLLADGILEGEVPPDLFPLRPDRF
jgi:D-amino-acid dehydrogenase